MDYADVSILSETVDFQLLFIQYYIVYYITLVPNNKYVNAKPQPGYARNGIRETCKFIGFRKS